MNEIQEVSELFYAALNSLLKGNMEPMIEIWSHADDVTYLSPFGDLRVGWDSVRQCWQEQADQNLGGFVEPADMHIIVSGDMAVTNNYELGHSNVHGKETDIKIRATNTYRKENGQWKMVGHHTDTIPGFE